MPFPTRLLAVVTATALSASGAADDAAIGIPIVAVPVTLTAQGVYKLTANVSTSQTSGCAITIASDFVTVDLQGYKIGGGGAGPLTSARGVCATDHRYITIRNGTIRGFRRAVEINHEIRTSQGHLVERVRAEGNTDVGLFVVGRSSVVRRNVIIGTVAPAIGTGDSAAGIVLFGPLSRVIDNDVSGTVADGGPAIGIDVAGDGVLVEGNRLTGESAPASIAISLAGHDILALRNRLSRWDRGVVFWPGTGSTGSYRDNLTSGVTTPFTGGTDAGGNQ